jgi:hypothetical protein
MNLCRICLLVLLTGMLAAFAYAGKIYTWTDENGVTHITEKPPPPGAQGQDVIEYTPKTDKQIEEIRRGQQTVREQQEMERAQQEAKDATRRAEQAKAKAAELSAVADQAFQRSEEFKKTTSYTIRRWQKNKTTRLRLEAEANQAREIASAAAQEAAELEKRAKAAEKRAEEALAQEKPVEKKTSKIKP